MKSHNEWFQRGWMNEWFYCKIWSKTTTLVRLDFLILTVPSTSKKIVLYMFLYPVSFHALYLSANRIIIVRLWDIPNEMKIGIDPSWDSFDVPSRQSHVSKGNPLFKTRIENIEGCELSAHVHGFCRNLYWHFTSRTFYHFTTLLPNHLQNQRNHRFILIVI